MISCPGLRIRLQGSNRASCWKDVVSQEIVFSGSKIPGIGFGTWKIELGQTALAVKEALKAGYRHFDCACDYGNEHEVGIGLQEGLTELGLKRSDIFVTSKLWNTNHAKEHVRSACEKSMADLKLDYLDLYLIHFPIAMQHVDASVAYPPGVPKDTQGTTLLASVPLRETWEAMESLVDAGLVKHIGISNFSSQLIYDLLTYARIRPSVNQIEVHPYLTQVRIINFCRSKGIHVTAFSPFGAPSYISLGVPSAIAAPSLFDHPTITTIAQKHHITSAQVLLRFGIDRGLSVIPKSSHPQRIAENLAASEATQLTEDDIQAILQLNLNLRFNDVGGAAVWGTDIYA